MIGWGLWLMIPFETFSQAPWAFLDRIAPEWVWGTLSVAIGLLMIAVSFDGPGARTAVSTIMVVGWLFIGFASLLTFPPATVSILFLLLGARQMHLAWRSATEWRNRRWTLNLKP